MHEAKPAAHVKVQVIGAVQSLSPAHSEQTNPGPGRSKQKPEIQPVPLLQGSPIAPRQMK